MLSSIFLSTVANIAILNTMSYIFIKLIPKKKKYKLDLKQKLWMVMLAYLTSFLLILFSVDLPEKVVLNFGYIILILLVYYYGYSITTPTAFLMATLHLLWGINPASISRAFMYIILGLVLPYMCKKLAKHFNKYAIFLMLNALCVSVMMIKLSFLYNDILFSAKICFILLILSSSIVIGVNAFIEDLIKNRNLYLHEQKRAKRDYLTGLRNMRAFNKKWQTISADQSIKTTAFMLLDIDHFKWINDNYGHANGNFILQQLATILKTGAPDRELIYRIGGEEFCLIINNMSYIEQKIAAEKVRSTVANHEFLLETGTVISITISIGLASSIKQKDMKNLFRLADHCLYSAKDKGRNRVISAIMEQ